MAELSRVLDKDALDDPTGPTGRASVCVPAEWLARGDTIEIVVPARIVCARCEGGGCDRCERRGGHRIEGDEAARRVRFALPRRTDTSTFVVRLVRPLGASSLEQLVVEIATGDAPSSGCERVATGRASHGAPPSPRGLAILVAVVLAAIVAIAVAASSMRR